MKSSSVNINIYSVNVNSIVVVKDYSGLSHIGIIRALVVKNDGADIGVKAVGNSEWIHFIGIEPLSVTDTFLSDNMTKESDSDIWSIDAGDELHIDVFKSPDKRFGNYIANVYDNNGYNFCSLDFLYIHQLQNILNYFNVKYELDVSSYHTLFND